MILTACGRITRRIIMRPAHADRLRGLDLALVDRLDAGAEILGLIGRIGDAEPDDRRLQRASA